MPRAPSRVIGPFVTSTPSAASRSSTCWGERSDDKQLSRVVNRYARLDLLCLDEIGYVHLDPRGAELLF